MLSLIVSDCDDRKFSGFLNVTYAAHAALNIQHQLFKGMVLLSRSELTTEIVLLNIYD